MSKFKVGDKVTPIVYRWANCVHPYLVEGNVYTIVRTEVELVDIEGVPSENVLEAGAHNTWRYDWDQGHFKLADGYILSNAFDQAVEEVGEIFVAKSLIGKETEMNAEQIRDEILRIDTRIEEAKKDIENAEKERDSLVEKLREKGFELSSKMQTVDVESDTCTVFNVKKGDVLILTKPSWNDLIPVGSEVRVLENDFSNVPLKVQPLDGWNGDWTKIDTVKFK